MALLNSLARGKIERTVFSIKKVETAIGPGFQEHFVNASSIPNAIEVFPVLEKRFKLPELDFNNCKRSRHSRGRRVKELVSSRLSTMAIEV